MVTPLLFLDVSGGEFLIIMLVAFLVLGPKQLPQVARKLGRTMNEIKSMSNEITREFKDETKHIASELKAARESSKVEVNDLSVDLSNSLKVEPPKRKNIFEDKPTSEVSVNNQSNNIQSVGNVNGETDNI
ncbi:MAG: Sec-independent protein translocase protein TatB [Chloroflexota bacterium]|jgi:sec-independent protein translocase protein TatB|nr:Sec-independent protein translocase protein TatB [Lentimicrobium sp.]